ncbi:MAG: DUF1643 domain-containing protein [Bacteroidia bacterium]
MAHIVGAKPLPLPRGVVSTAVYGGPDDCYRYRLEWMVAGQVALRPIMWLLMNPSVASEHGADRTMLKCWKFSNAWGFNRMLVGNAAAYRATDSRRLAEASDPVGSANPEHLLAMAAEAGMVVVGHGQPAAKRSKLHGPRAVKLLRDAGHKLHVLRLSSGPGGHEMPWHPLYLPDNLRPMQW